MGSMNAPNEQRGLFSRLPDEQEYWREFTDKIVNDAAPRLAEFGSDESRWWSEMARYSTLLAAGAAAAVIALLVLGPTGDGPAAEASTRDTYGLAPVDPLAATLVSGETPPSVGTLIAVRNTEYER